MICPNNSVDTPSILILHEHFYHAINPPRGEHSSKLPKGLLDELFALDKGIRYVAILSVRGAHLEGGMRPGTVSLNPEDEENKMFLQATVARGMSESWRRFFGDFKFSFFAYEKLNLVEFPYGENVLLVTTEPRVPLTVAHDIIKIINKYKKTSSKENLR